MKISRKQLSNGFFVIFICLVLFTPVGFWLKVQVSKLLSFGVSETKKELQIKVASYNWELEDIKGKPINLSAKKGQVILINFWATWCPPCVAEMPSMQLVYNNYKDKMVFLFVANDDKDKVATFLKKHNYDLPIYFERSNTPEALLSKSIPTTYVLDTSGKIRIVKTGAADWNAKSTRAILDSLLLE